MLASWLEQAYIQGDLLSAMMNPIGVTFTGLTYSMSIEEARDAVWTIVQRCYEIARDERQRRGLG